MIYLDNAATTKPFSYIKDFFNEYEKKYWFNPSSIYKNSINVKNKIIEAKNFIKTNFNLESFNLFFTFSGTFSNNLILNPYTLLNIKKDIEKKINKTIQTPEIIVGIYEHSSVINPVKEINNKLKKDFNFKIKYIDLKEFYQKFIKISLDNKKLDNKKLDNKKLDNKKLNNETLNNEKLDNKILNNEILNNENLINIDKLFKQYIIEKFKKAVNENTIFVSCMWVHNESGLILPVKEISKEIKKINKNIFIHVDATQGFMKLPVFDTAYIDSLSAASHKFHSIRGTGFLFIKNKDYISPLIFGGGQESGIVPSTENVFSILATYEVIKNEFSKINHYFEKATILKNTLYNEIKINMSDLKNKIIPLSFFNFFSPYINRIYIGNTKSEVIVNALSEENIFVSAGSACSSNARKKINGKILDDETIFGIPSNFKEGGIRISFGYFTNKEEITTFVLTLKKIIKTFF